MTFGYSGVLRQYNCVKREESWVVPFRVKNVLIIDLMNSRFVFILVFRRQITEVSCSFYHHQRLASIGRLTRMRIDIYFGDLWELHSRGTSRSGLDYPYRQPLFRSQSWPGIENGVNWTKSPSEWRTGVVRLGDPIRVHIIQDITEKTAQQAKVLGSWE